MKIEPSEETAKKYLNFISNKERNKNSMTERAHSDNSRSKNLSTMTFEFSQNSSNHSEDKMLNKKRSHR